MLPTIAADGDARVAIGFELFDAEGQPPARFDYIVRLNTNPLAGTGWDFTTPVVAGGGEPNAISTPQKTVVQPFGAYFDTIPRQQSSGFGVTTPGCSGTGDFFTFFVRPSDAGTAQIESRGIQVP